MPVWRCPHCGTPQAETSRCWVCRRSTTSCGTCRHFRRGIAGGLGLCGLDPRHLALRGTEMRACWDAPEVAGASPVAGDPPAVAPSGDVVVARTRTFVPVDELDRTRQAEEAAVTASARPTGPGTTGERRGWSLWGDVER